DAVVGPNRSAHPLPLLDDVRDCFLDELAHSAESFPAPVSEFGDSFRDEFRCRLALACARLFHVLILEVHKKVRGLQLDILTANSCLEFMPKNLGPKHGPSRSKTVCLG